jgi:hypothetical protein
LGIPDPRLIRDALDAGYRVFAPSFKFDSIRDVPPGVEAVVTDHIYAGGQIIEFRRSTNAMIQPSRRGP